MTKYTGVCVNRLGDTIINSVRVKFSDSGSEIDIDPGTYIKRNVQPSLGSLPDCKTLTKDSEAKP
jgi:hypothetical protein